MPKPHQNMLKERNVSPDRRRRCWVVKNYDNGLVAGRVELEADLFVAIQPDGNIVGKYSTLTAARVALLPQAKRPINCV
jgi:hypothetical protein